jgi:enoyl-CoA hydratase/carnithine racemase
MTDALHKRIPGTVKREDIGNVAVLRLSRPGRRNAFGMDIAASLTERLHAVSLDESIRAVVLTGEGDTFSSGADIGSSDTHNVASIGEGLSRHSAGLDMFDSLVRFSKPIISAVAGYAIGAGFLITLTTDIIVCSDDAKFSIPNVPLGILPAHGGMARLAEWVGKGRAMEIGLTGRRVHADEALRIGITTSVVPADRLLDEALSIASKLASYPPLAVRLAKESLNASSEDVVVQPSVRGDYYRFTSLMATDDVREAHTAWREKREPVFRGR